MTSLSCGSIAVSILQGRDGVLPDIKDAWERCLADAPEHQQLFGFEWSSGWLRHLGSEGEWTGDSRLFLAHDSQGKLRGILPLAKRRFHGAAVWSLAEGYQPVRGFVCHEAVNAEVCAAFAQAMLKMQGWLELYRFGPTDTAYPERAALVGELSKRCRRVVVFHNKPTIVVGSLPTSLEDYERMIKTQSSMKGIRYYERKVAREGQFEVRRFKNCQGEELRSMLEDCAAIEKKSWLASSKSGQPRFVSASNQRFWEFVCSRQLSPMGQLDAWIGYFNDRPVAFLFTITIGAIRYTIANQYDEEYAKYRLGSVLFLKLLEDCVRNEIRSIDMGTGDLHYKSRWGGKEDAMHYDIVVFPPGPIGYLITWLLKIEPLYKAAKRALHS